MLLDFISFSQRLWGIAFCYNATLLCSCYSIKKMRNALTFNVNETFSTGDNATKSYKNDVKKDHERKNPWQSGKESRRENVSLLSESVVARKQESGPTEWEGVKKREIWKCIVGHKKRTMHRKPMVMSNKTLLYGVYGHLFAIVNVCVCSLVFFIRMMY